MASIAALMRRVSDGTGLRLRLHPDLRGASVTGPRVQAYVVPTTTGWQICFWHATAANPYRIYRTESLDEAVDLAVSAALDPRGRKAWRTGHPAPPASGTLRRHTRAESTRREVRDGQLQH